MPETDSRAKMFAKLFAQDFTPQPKSPGEPKLKTPMEVLAERQSESGIRRDMATLEELNGTRDANNIPSFGAQQAVQKVEENEKTGLMQRVAGFLNKMNPFDNLFPDNRVDYVSPDGSIQKVNPDFLKLIQNRPDLKRKFDATGSIYSDFDM